MMQQRHGDATRLLPGDPQAEAGFEITPMMAFGSTFTGPGKFGKMFPNLAAFRPKDEALLELGTAMEDNNFPGPDDPVGNNARIPAGFTYLGQFIDHDITFDKTVGFPEDIFDPSEIVQARTPTLDLDSLYGAGPQRQPELYEAQGGAGRGKFKIGRTSPDPSPLVNGTSLPHDLPRNPQTNVAIIADPRNDENLIVAQTHLAFLQFHNKVLDAVVKNPPTRGKARGGKPDFGSIPGIIRLKVPFEQARMIVRWHYQWIVLHDFLRRVVREDVLDDVLDNGRKFYKFEGGRGSRRKPFMPLEHSVAAYRLGHSMIRQTYDYNRVFRFGGLAAATLPLLFHFTGNARNALPGLPPGAPIPSNWIIDWRRFFEVDQTGAVAPTPSRKLDPKIANPLNDLPEFRGTSNQPGALAQRNLLRGSRVGLPSGQAVVKLIKANPLTEAELTSGSTGPTVKKYGFEKETPLWFYILKEAEVREGGTRLGETGSRILSEVFVGLLEGDKLSFLNKKRTWKPVLPGAQPGNFTMADMLNFVGNINPIGEKPEDT